MSGLSSISINTPQTDEMVDLVLTSYDIAEQCRRKLLQKEGNPQEIQDLCKRAFTNYEKAALQGNVKAMYQLGLCYRHAIGTELNHEQEKKWLCDAAEKDHVGALGICYFEGYNKYEKNGELAFKYFNELANKNDVYGQFMIGNCYLRGIGVKPDEEQALTYFKKSGDQGLAIAERSVGQCYAKRKNPLKAFEWYKRSALGGDKKGIVSLGCCYLDGNGVTPPDYKKAVYYFSQFDHPESQCLLARCYQRGWGVTQNSKEALKLYLKAADGGYLEAKVCLVWYYSEISNSNEAHKWKLKAAEGGDVSSQRSLGDYYMHIKKDPTEALKWYIKCAEGGEINRLEYYCRELNYPNEAIEWYEKEAKKDNIVALFELAYCYYNGLGRSKDLEKAYQYFQKAATLGCAHSLYYLGTFYFEGIVVEKSAEDGCKNYKKAADKGWVLAQRILGDCYYNGTGVPEDFVAAFDWYNKALMNRDVKAEYKIGFFYEFGIGDCKQDIGKAREIYEGYHLWDDQDALYSRAKLKESYLKLHKPDDKDLLSTIKELYEHARKLGHPRAEKKMAKLSKVQELTQKEVNLQETPDLRKQIYLHNEKAAQEGDVEAMYQLGLCYRHTIGIKPDKEEEKKWLCDAAAKGHTGALGICYLEGYNRDKNEKLAFDCFNELAEKDDAYCQYMVGICYLNGTGVDKDENKAFMYLKKSGNHGLAVYISGNCIAECYIKRKNPVLAFQWYKRSAIHGDTKGKANLGRCYFKGEGVHVNYKKAFHWLSQSDDPESQFLLAQCYSKGWGVTKNLDEALTLYMKAAEAGLVEAYLALGELYRFEIKDLNKAVEWCEKDILKDSKSALFNLGCIYNEVKNLEKSYQYFQKAADLGCSISLLNMGVLLLNKGVPQSNIEAAQYFKMAAEKGVVKAQYLLGNCYYDGIGVAEDYKSAYEWYEKAAKSKHGDALNKIGLFYEHGIGDRRKDGYQAYRYYKDSADKENPDGLYNLGRCYQYAIGCGKEDLSKAKECYQRAAKLGHKEAEKILSESSKCLIQ